MLLMKIIYLRQNERKNLTAFNKTRDKKIF